MPVVCGFAKMGSPKEHEEGGEIKAFYKEHSKKDERAQQGLIGVGKGAWT